MAYINVTQDQDSLNYEIDNLSSTSGIADTQYLASIPRRFNECEGMAMGTTEHIAIAYSLLQPAFATALHEANDKALYQFFYFTAEAHFDTGILQLCALYDTGRINHSTLRDLDKFQHKQTEQVPFTISDKAESLYTSLKDYRDKRIAHPDRNAERILEALQWHDPLKLLHLTNAYLTRFHNTYLFTDYEMGDDSVAETMRSTILSFHQLGQMNIDMAQWLKEAEQYAKLLI